MKNKMKNNFELIFSEGTCNKTCNFTESNINSHWDQ